MIIGLSGKKGSGKTTVANMLLEYFPNHEIVGFADKLKQVLSLLTGMPGLSLTHQSVKQMPLPKEWQSDLPGDLTYRKALQFIGTELFRNQFHPDTWVNALFADYKSHKNWIVHDVRFPNEMARIKANNGIMVRIIRNGVEEDSHESETALDRAQFDFVIENHYDLEHLGWEVANGLVPFIKNHFK